MKRKQMLARVLGLSLCGALMTTSLSGCGIVRKLLSQQKETQTTSHHTPGLELPEPDSQTKPDTAGDISMLHPIMTNHYDSTSDDSYNILTSVKYSFCTLSPEDELVYPELAATLNAYANKLGEDHEDVTIEEYEYMKEYVDEYGYDGMYCENERTAYVQRADSVCFSVLEYDYYYSGGAHGFYCYGGLNVDTQTGLTLTASDVISDMDAFKAYYVDAIMNQVEDDFLTKENVEEYWDEMNAGEWDWNMVMDYEGISFYVAPGNLASYAAGVLQVRLSYTEQADMIVDKYEQVPQEYIQALAPYMDSYVDYDMDGKAETLSVSYSRDEYEYITEADITANGDAYTAEVYAFECQPYYVRANGKSYLYIWQKSENDWEMFNIYDLNGTGITKVGDSISRFHISGNSDWNEVDASKNRWVSYYSYVEITDPNFLPMAYRVDKPSTVMSYLTCHVDASGRIVDDETYFDTTTDCFSRWFSEDENYTPTLTSLMDITAYELSSDRAVGDEVVIPSGSTFDLVGTDNDTYADYLCNGMLIRIFFTGNYNDIGGYDIFEVFEGVFFAG